MAVPGSCRRPDRRHQSRLGDAHTGSRTAQARQNARIRWVRVTRTEWALTFIAAIVRPGPVAHRMAREIRAGMVWINADKVMHPGSPFGDAGESSSDCDMGFEVVHEYTRPKSVRVNIGARIPPHDPR